MLLGNSLPNNHDNNAATFITNLNLDKSGFPFTMPIANKIERSFSFAKNTLSGTLSKIKTSIVGGINVMVIEWAVFHETRNAPSITDTHGN